MTINEVNISTQFNLLEFYVKIRFMVLRYYPWKKQSNTSVQFGNLYFNLTIEEYYNYLLCESLYSLLQLEKINIQLLY
jgi:hypothetical protein